MALIRAQGYVRGSQRYHLSLLEYFDAWLARRERTLNQVDGAHWIERYLSECRPRLEVSTREPALFLSGYGERFSAGYVGNWVRRVLEKASVDRPGSCHLLRHSCATHMLEGGADIRFIQQLLGHASLETTQVYTSLTIQQLREVHTRCHPHGRRVSATEPPAA